MSFIGTIFEALSYPFMQKALLAGTFVAIACSFIGIFIVLRKVSMIGDGLAHVGFAAIAVSLALGASPLYLSLPIVVLSSFCIQWMHDKAKIDGDAAIGILSAVAIAIGVMIASLSQGLNIDIYSYLFGSILTIEMPDVYGALILSIVTGVVIILNFKDMFAMSYDEEFAKVMGVPVKRINYIMLALIGVTVMIGIRVVGTLLISSLILFPTIIAMQFGHGFKKTIIIALIFSIFTLWVGIIISFVFNLPTGATIVLFQLFNFMCVFVLKKIKS